MSQINDSVVFNYYDHSRGWEETNKGWHQVTLDNIRSFKHLEMIHWLYDNLDHPERHCRWIRFSHGSGFKFRYERDYIMFTLRWS